MSFIKQSAENFLIFDTRVENFFISEYMAKAPGEYVKAYLLGLMYAEQGLPLEDADIARELGMSAPEVSACWDYWASEGLAEKHPRSPGSKDCDIEFISARERFYGRPARSRSRIDLQDEELRKLYEAISAKTARLLDAKAMEEISSWLSVYKMSPELVLCGYDYCIEKNRSTEYKYVGRVLKDWKAKGLDTPAAVKDALEAQDRDYALFRRIFRALGFTGRNPGEEEKRIMSSWQSELGFGEERILEACAKTAGISNPNIKYVDKVLRNWYTEEHSAGERSETEIMAAVNVLYEEDRRRNEAEVQARRKEIYAKLPRLEEINSEMKDTGFRISKAAFMGENGKATIARERSRMKRLSEERAELLKKNGYAPDALDMRYTCAKCRDTGELEDGSRCSCYGEKLALVRSRSEG